MSSNLTSLTKKQQSAKEAKKFIEGATGGKSDVNNIPLKRLNVDVPAELHKEIKVCAAQQSCDIRDIVIKAINDYLHK